MGAIVMNTSHKRTFMGWTLYRVCMYVNVFADSHRQRAPQPPMIWAMGGGEVNEQNKKHPIKIHIHSNALTTSIERREERGER